MREEQSQEIREDPVRTPFDREHEAERPRPTADRERSERDAEESRERIPVGVDA